MSGGVLFAGAEVGAGGVGAPVAFVAARGVDALGMLVVVGAMAVLDVAVLTSVLDAVGAPGIAGAPGIVMCCQRSHGEFVRQPPGFTLVRSQHGLGSIPCVTRIPSQSGACLQRALHCSRDAAWLAGSPSPGTTSAPWPLTQLRPLWRTQRLMPAARAPADESVMSTSSIIWFPLGVASSLWVPPATATRTRAVAMQVTAMIRVVGWRPEHHPGLRCSASAPSRGAASSRASPAPSSALDSQELSLAEMRAYAWLSLAAIAARAWPRPPR
mmetsp:Transcript_92336/g.261410  ORF Transcript_92336/g.261410 Transcript_92336/m.261410 type:complete len:270 (+) Transcript_92336:898-1707(+)